MNAGRRTISIAELNMKERIVFDSEIARFAAMGTRQVTNHVKLAATNKTKTNPKGRRNLHAVDSWSFETSW